MNRLKETNGAPSAPSNGESNSCIAGEGWEQMTFQGEGTDFGRETLRGTVACPEAEKHERM